MNPTAEVLKKTANYYKHHPDAWSNGYHLGIAIRDNAEYTDANAGEALETVREAIGASGVIGSLTVWSRKHSREDAIKLLQAVAKEVLQ